MKILNTYSAKGVFMDKINQQRFKVILLLGIITILLFGGILVNQSINNYISASSNDISEQSVFLPSLSSKRCYGTEKDDSYVDAFFIGDDTYVFYNGDCGIMEKESNGNTVDVKLEGKLLAVALTSSGFAVAIEKDGNLSIKLLGFDGIPTCSISITLKNAQLQHLDYDGNVCLLIKYQGDFDYVLSYFKYDLSLSEVYHRDIYSLYNLSAVACYPMSNKTVIFFSAQYGSVRRGGYSVLHNSSLAVETEYFSSLEDYTVCDAKPYKDGFLVTAISNLKPYSIILDQNMKQSLTELSTNVYDDAKIYTDANSCYVSLVKDNSVDLVNMNEQNEITYHFADRVYDCVFIDGSAVFATVKNNVTYVSHLNTGITSPILNSAPLSIKLKKNNKLTLFATFDATDSSILKKGGVDVFCVTLL